MPTIYDNSNHFDALIRHCHEIQRLLTENLVLTVDFHYCEFLGHNGVAWLGGLARLVESCGGKVDFQWDTLPHRIRVNLAQNGFLCDFGYNLEPWDGNSIPYRCDLMHDENAIADYLRYKWLGKGWVNISPGLKDAITGQAMEIYLNAFEHSQSEIGVFSCGQHYPKAGILQLTVIDFGVGIPENVRTLPQNSSMTATEALAWALQSGTSTKHDGICRGTGLNLLQEFIAKNHGNLIIYSNNSHVKIGDNEVRYENKGINFSGTLINIAFQCDEHHYCLASEISDPQRHWF